MLNNNAIILAAGKGKRMGSNYPKVLHNLAGKPMVQYVIDAANDFNIHNIYLVYGYGETLLRNKITGYQLHWILQQEQLGTAHAIQQVIPYLKDDEDVFILYGDVPLISKNTLQRLYNAKPSNGIGLLTMIIDNPKGYGRVIRKNGMITEIIEEQDASLDQLKINEVNTGILIINSSNLKNWLKKINNNNHQKEYYITDIIKIAYQNNCIINAIHPDHVYETTGVNDCLQLSKLERIYQTKQAEALLLKGVMLRDPSRFDLRGTLIHGHDIEIDTNVNIEGLVILGNNVKIGSGCIIKNSTIDNNCIIHPYSVINNSHLSIGCRIGPFANLRADTYLSKLVHLGNFVETKKTSIGKHSKVNHLSYLGDAEIGSCVNIGAGTITCNYDGQNKLKTVIGNNVFIGSDSQLIAPLNIIDNSTIAAGTTVMKNVDTGTGLVFNEKKQKCKVNWQRPQKKNKCVK
ncbi:MAG: UDP-N-acetylglucosamine diphosphorylase/glucosamine-1-phosphate N-acetyltransferase [Pantoea sp. Brub]|nr:UDP-N-acetylglucosamine diphosphorylase/glucosamine-1-phosphate N-acetyltransferase [Pantoea sp. Brub]